MNVQEIYQIPISPPDKPVLLLYTTKCRYSSELNKEIQRMPNVNSCCIVVDLSQLSDDEIEKIVWLPGVPCLVESERLYLGVDAFRKIREILRTKLV